MEITAKLDAYDLDAIRILVREEITAALAKTKKATPRADKLEEQAQAAIASAPEPRTDITDEDLPENMRSHVPPEHNCGKYHCATRDLMFPAPRPGVEKAFEASVSKNGKLLESFAETSTIYRDGEKIAENVGIGGFVDTRPVSLLPELNQDHPITAEDKVALTPRIRALALGPGVFKEWVKRNSGLDDPWQMGFCRFELMLDMFEAKKGEGSEAIARFIAGV